MPENREKKGCICPICGKRLPIEVVSVEGKAVFSVFCRHCKTVTVLSVGKK